MTIRMEVWGDHALFTRPEYKVERLTYEVMTPSAARGIVEAVYYHPGLKWSIDRIFVLNPIRFASIRRNELKAKCPATSARAVMDGKDAPLWLSCKDEIQQRAALVLRDVRYVIEAHFELTQRATPGDNAGKFQDIVKRRLQQGQCFHTPYLGVREFPAYFCRHNGAEITTAYAGEEHDLGLMLYDMDYRDPTNIRPLFFHAVMKDGVLDLRDQEVSG